MAKARMSLESPERMVGVERVVGGRVARPQSLAAAGIVAGDAVCPAAAHGDHLAAGRGNQRPTTKDYYYFLVGVGRKTELVATQLLGLVLCVLSLPQRLLLVIDDSPTKRYGPKVEGAESITIRRPVRPISRFCMGTFGSRFRWPCGIRAGVRWRCRCGRCCTSASRRSRRFPSTVVGRRFATKLQLAARLVEWVVPLLKQAGKTVWLVVDGGYTKRPFLRRALETGVTIVGRLRKDAALRDVPPKLKQGARRGRGRPRKYGRNKLSLAKRAGQKRGWQTIDCTVYGEASRKTLQDLPGHLPAGRRHDSRGARPRKIMVGTPSSRPTRMPAFKRFWKHSPIGPRSNRTFTT